MVFKWNEQSTLLFLENFKNYQCLWNHKLDEYKNKILRGNAMKSLISDLHLEVTEEDIKHKIKTIRTRYTTELTKIKQSTKSGCSSDDVYVPTLYWFRHADFLNSVCVPRQSTSNLDASVNTHIDSQLTLNEDSVEPEQNSSETGSEKKKTSNCENNKNGSSGLTTQFHSGKPINRKRKTDMPIDRAIKELKTISERNKEQVEDEFDLFCKSLALQLKKMPLKRALMCQEKLQSVMTQERLAQLSESICSGSSTLSPSNTNQSHQYDPNYLSPSQQEQEQEQDGHYYVTEEQVQSSMAPAPMTSPQDGHYYVTEEQVQSSMVPVPMTSPQDGHYYVTVTEEQVQPSMIPVPLTSPQEMNQIAKAQSSTQERILSEAIKSIM